MAKSLKVGVTIQGWKELAKKLNGDELLSEPWTAAMKSASEVALSAWRAASASASGQMQAKMIAKVQAKPVPKWIALRTSATRSSRKYKRYRYPGRQEYDPKSRNRGKLKRALDGAIGRVQAILGGAAGKIEAKWRT